MGIHYRIEGTKFVGTRELPIVLVDFDDTIGSLASAWLEMLNKTTGSNLVLEDLTTWDFASIMGQDGYTSLRLLDNYAHFAPFPGVVDKLKKLSQFAKIIIVTASKTGMSAASKIEICNKLFPEYEVWKAESKHNIKAFAIVDDNPGTAKSAKEQGIITCAIKHPWHNSSVHDSYDLLADSYLDPGAAWEQIASFLISSLKNATKTKALGKRYNHGKPAYDLIPPSIFTFLLQRSRTKKRSVSQLVNKIILWRNTLPTINKDSLPTHDRDLLLSIISIIVDFLWEDNKHQFDKKTKLFPGLFAADQVARVLTGGAIKYAPRNWESGLSFIETWASGMRHIQAILRGKATDDESTLSHWAHALCNFCFLLHFSEQYSRYSHLDDR